MWGQTGGVLDFSGNKSLFQHIPAFFSIYSKVQSYLIVPLLRQTKVKRKEKGNSYLAGDHVTWSKQWVELIIFFCSFLSPFFQMNILIVLRMLFRVLFLSSLPLREFRRFLFPLLKRMAKCTAKRKKIISVEVGSSSISVWTRRQLEASKLDWRWPVRSGRSPRSLLWERALCRWRG